MFRVAQDLRYGARQLLANPGFSLVAILSLALGIGANTAIFQLLNAVRLRNLPLANPRELVEIKIVGGNHGMGLNSSYGPLTRPIWEEIRREHPPFSGVLAWSTDQMAVGEGTDFQPVKGITVSGDFFRVLGVAPWRGRLISSDDEHAWPAATAVVGHDFWQSRMGGREIDEPRLRARLTDGLVITIEPIISAGNGQSVLDRDRWTIRTADGSLSAHYEHTIVVTKNEPILLTAA